MGNEGSWTGETNDNNDIERRTSDIKSQENNLKDGKDVHKEGKECKDGGQKGSLIARKEFVNDAADKRDKESNRIMGRVKGIIMPCLQGLIHCKGKRRVRVRLVELSIKSLNEGNNKYFLYYIHIHIHYIPVICIIINCYLLND